MSKRGLTHERVVHAAEEMIAESGYDNFSINELARRLGVKPASLYNHMKNAEELSTEIGLRAIKSLASAMDDATAGKEGDEAVWALAVSYRKFGHESPDLYRVIMSLPMTDNEVLIEATPEIVRPILDALSVYHLDELEKIHWQRILRSVMHGFVSQENAGFFNHYPASNEESYRMAVFAVIGGIHGSHRLV